MSSEVSLNELATQLKVNTATVDNYIDLLEKSGVVYRLKAYSTNERKEVTKMKKIYFWDNGIRNAILGNFDNPINRNDLGALWENFIITERIKLNQYNNKNVQSYFWRSKQQQEIDYIEVDKKNINGFEFKWNPNAKGKPTKAFNNIYPEANIQIINSQNYSSFVGL
jgi:predicted AAA+ superfamily ATPase